MQFVMFSGPVGIPTMPPWLPSPPVLLWMTVLTWQSAMVVVPALLPTSPAARILLE